MKRFLLTFGVLVVLLSSSNTGMGCAAGLLCDALLHEYGTTQTVPPAVALTLGTGDDTAKTRSPDDLVAARSIQVVTDGIRAIRPFGRSLAASLILAVRFSQAGL